MTELDRIIEAVWQERVASRFVFRGMSREDLTDPLDPGRDPHAAAADMLRDCLGLVRRVLDSGPRFTVVETHWGRSWQHDPADIVRWSLRDLAAGRIDFTTSLREAREYADNRGGSQLKQNLLTITEELLRQPGNPEVEGLLSGADRDLLRRVNAWAANGAGRHRGIVLHLRRSHPALRSPDPCAPVGPRPQFRSRIRNELTGRELPVSRRAVVSLLPRGNAPFEVYVAEPLPLHDIERIEESRAPDPVRQESDIP